MNTKELHVTATAIQWDPEHADEILARLASLGFSNSGFCCRDCVGDRDYSAFACLSSRLFYLACRASFDVGAFSRTCRLSLGQLFSQFDDKRVTVVNRFCFFGWLLPAFLWRRLRCLVLNKDIKSCLLISHLNKHPQDLRRAF